MPLIFMDISCVQSYGTIQVNVLVVNDGLLWLRRVSLLYMQNDEFHFHLKRHKISNVCMRPFEVGVPSYHGYRDAAIPVDLRTNSWLIGWFVDTV